MIPFKEMVASDRTAVFLNLDEFGEMYDVEGAQVQAVMDSDDHVTNKPEVAVETEDCRFMARVEDMPARRQAGDLIEIEQRIYIIEQWTEDMGIATLHLKMNSD